MKVHAESMFKSKTQLSLLNHHKELSSIAQRRVANTQKQQQSYLVPSSDKENSQKHLTESCEVKSQLRLPALLKPTLGSNFSLLNKQFRYFGDYDYFDIEKVIQDDLCKSLQSMKVRLPFNLMTVKHDLTFKLPSIKNRTANKSSLKHKQTCHTNIQTDRENDAASINKEPVSAVTHKRPHALDFFDVDNNFKIDVKSINETPISSRTHCTMHKYGSRVYIVGGFGRKMFAEAVIYDTANQQILEFKSILFKRARHASACIGNFIVIHGGLTLECYGSRFTLSDTILFDLRWITRETLGQPR